MRTFYIKCLNRRNAEILADVLDKVLMREYKIEDFEWRENIVKIICRKREEEGIFGVEREEEEGLEEEEELF